MAARTPLTPQQVLALIPQQKPFRFVDEIVKVDETGATGNYTFKHDEFFYAGHFPDEPITPGVILVESMCQIGVVALGLYLLAMEIPADELVQHKTLFTDAEMEFSGIVMPGDTVTVRAEKVFWRRRKLRSKVEMTKADGSVVANGVVSGLGVNRGT